MSLGKVLLRGPGPLGWRCHRTLLFSLALGFAVAISLHRHGLASPLQSPDIPPIKVSFCELIKSPQNYAGKIIETSGLYWRTFETSLLQVPGCAGTNSNQHAANERRGGIRDFIWIDLNDLHPSKAAVVSSPTEPACQTKVPNGSASVTLTGRFSHAPDHLRKTPNGDDNLNPAFGHLHQFRSMIEVDCLRVLIDPPW